MYVFILLIHDWICTVTDMITLTKTTLTKDPFSFFYLKHDQLPFQVLGWPFFFSQPNFCHTKVQQATFGGIGLVTETAHVEDDARRAAGFALGVEQQVAKQLEEAKRQAHEEVRLIFFRGGLGGFIHMCQGLIWGRWSSTFYQGIQKKGM